MKKMTHALLFTIMFFLSVTKINAASSIEIKSVELDTKSENTVINSEPTFNGLEMHYNLTFKEVNDYAKYKIVIENNTDKEFKVSEDKSFEISEYVTYNYTSDQIIAANSETVVYINIKYTKEIEEELLVEGTYKETNNAVLQILDENDKAVVNPKTGVSNPEIFICAVLIAFIVCAIIIFGKKQITFVLLIGICLMPIIAYAIEELKLVINVEVEIIPEVTPITPPEPEKYSVSYVLKDFHVLLKDSELNDYDLSKTECETIYVGEEIEANKYNKCYGTVILRDSTQYKAGDIVQLKTISFRGIEWPTRSIDYREAYIQEDEYVLQEWEYSFELMNEYNLIPQDNDFEVMNPSSYIYNSWQESKRICISSSAIFTMPAHDMVWGFLTTYIK